MSLAPSPTRGSVQPTSKRAAQRKAKEDTRKKQKFDFRLVQERLRSKYNITTKGSLRIYLAESAYPPREVAQASGGPKRPTDRKKAYIPPVAGGEWDLLTQRSLVTIPRKGQYLTHAAIPNPNYKPNTSTCKFAALRLDQCMPPDHQASIIQKIKMLKTLNARFEVTKAHGTSFQQLWLGIWKPYVLAPRVAAGYCPAPRTPLAIALSDLVASIHPIMADKPAKLLAEFDSDTAHRMRFNHQVVAKGMADSVHLQKQPNQNWHAADSSRKNTSNFRLGGMGSMLAVSISTAKGTDFHYDDNDHSQVYSVIVVLGADGNLHLPEVGYKVHVPRGSVVFFPANQQLHKLDIDESAGPDAEQFVLTFWTDARSMKYLEQTNHKDFYSASELGVNEGLGDLEHCYIVAPGSREPQD